MNFDIPSNTGEQEPKYPSLDEVRTKIESLTGKENLKVERMLEDEKGVYFYEVSTVNDKGDAVLYLYRRMGVYKETRAGETTIEAAYFRGPLEDNDCASGETLADYDEATGSWKDPKGTQRP